MEALARCWYRFVGSGVGGFGASQGAGQVYTCAQEFFI